jgi:hypothetical protein
MVDGSNRVEEAEMRYEWHALRMVKGENRQSDLLERQRTQIARAGAERVDRVGVFGDWVVGLAMRDGRFDADDGE